MALLSSFTLPSEHEQILRGLVRRGKAAARMITRAHVLLQANQGDCAVEIAQRLGVCADTVYSILNRYEVGGLDRALRDQPRPGQPRHFTDQHIQAIVALACQKPPEGRAHWTLALLHEQILARQIVPAISLQSLSRILRHHDLKPWREKNVVHS